MSAEFRLQLPKRMLSGDPAIVREWNAMRKALEDLERAVRARTLRPTPTTRIAVAADGTRVTAAPPLPTRVQLLPFTVFIAEGGKLSAAAGTINGDSHAVETKTSPANGTWYFEAKVVINSTTGAITSTDVQWVSTESSDTTTDFYETLGEITVTDGAPVPETVVQYNYGPLFAFAYGTPTDKWAVRIL